MIIPFKAHRTPRASASRATPSSAAREAISLSVEFRAYDARVKQRRYFTSEDAYTEHQRIVAIYRANEATTEWTYPIPVADWTANDVNKLVARVLATLAELDDPDTTYQPRNPYHDPQRAGVVKFMRMGRADNPRTAYTRVVITSRAKPYYANVDVPGAPIPAIAFFELFQNAEAGACVEVALIGDTAFGYFPVTDADHGRSGR